MGPDDEKVKPQGLKLPYTIPTQVEAFPTAIPSITESKSSIKNVMNDSIADAPAAGDVVVDEYGDVILETLVVFAGVTGYQARVAVPFVGECS